MKNFRAFLKTHQNNFKLLFLLIPVYILIHPLAESILQKVIVTPVLSKVYSAWYNDIIMFLLQVWIIWSVWKKRRSAYRLNAVTILIFSTGLLYLYYRFFSNIWEFASYYLLDGLKYADVVFLIAGMHLIFLVWHKKAADKLKNNLFDDRPTTQDADLLGYAEYAKNIAEQIQRNSFDRSFAIGVNGVWGSGKTSFLDMIKCNLDDESIIEITFNPWGRQTPNSIILDFFDEVQEAIQPYDPSLSRRILKYADKLTSVNTGSLSIPKIALQSALNLDSLSKQYNDINVSLQSIDKKLVVYIDDLDRLDKDEVIEVIRLIRNTANFYNTFFIVAYDRSYVSSALSAYNEYRPEKFIEKIFQLEITLPKFDSSVLRKELIKKLCISLPEKYNSEISDAVGNKPWIVQDCFDNWLNNMRDVTRLANSVIINSKNLLGEVELSDFIRLEILRLNHPTIYELIYRESHVFLESHDSGSGRFTYSIRYNRKDGSYVKSKNTKSDLEIFLIKNRKALAINRSEIEKIHNLISGIFRSNTVSIIPLRSVLFPSKFGRYFTYSLLKYDLSEIEFSKARSKSQPEFFESIMGWVNKGLEEEVKRRLEDVNEFDDQDDFEKIIRSIFQFARLKTKFPESSSYVGKMIGFDRKNLYQKMGNKSEYVRLFYLDKDDGKEQYLSFVQSLFEDVLAPYSFESDFLHFVQDQIQPEFILDAKTLKEYRLKYFEQYLQSVDSLDNNVWFLWHKTKTTTWETGGDKIKAYYKENEFPEKAIKFFKDFIITKDMIGFLTSIVKREPLNEQSHGIYKDTVVDIYGSIGEFKEELNKIDPMDHSIQEFREFYDQWYRSVKTREYIDFEFKHLKI